MGAQAAHAQAFFLPFCHCCIPAIMSQQSEPMNTLVQQQSVSNIFSRMVARSKGMPVPFTSRFVQNSESGQGWTMFNDYPFRSDGGLMSVMYPCIGGFGACIVLGKMLAKRG